MVFTQRKKGPSKNNSLNRIVVVIPAYNVAKHILPVIETIPEFVYAIIVVEDGGSDNTAELVRNLQNPRVYLIQHEHNQGVGGATLTGFQKALELGADLIIKMDGDGQMDPAYLPNLIAPLLAGDADYTKGNRFLYLDSLSQMPLIRNLGNIGLSFITKIASGYWGVFDPSNGYVAIHKSALKLLDLSRIHRRYGFETSMLLELSLHRAVVEDVYIPARYGDENSSLQVHHVFFVLIALLVSGFFRRMLIQYFFRDFNGGSIFIIFGILLLAFSMLWGGFYWIQALITRNSTPLGTVMIAVVALIVGIQFLLQAVVLDIQGVPSHPIQRSSQYLHQWE